MNKLFSEIRKRCDDATEIKLTQGKVALIDKASLPLIKGYGWGVSPGAKTFYARATRNKKTVRMHRLILGIDDPSIQVDHIDGNGLNNRLSNLRACTQAENLRNTSRKTNTSGFKGVSRHGNRWQACISINRKRLTLGKFLTKEEAAFVYDQAAIKLHGNFARLNFPFVYKAIQKIQKLSDEAAK